MSLERIIRALQKAEEKKGGEILTALCHKGRLVRSEPEAQSESKLALIGKCACNNHEIPAGEIGCRIVKVRRVREIERIHTEIQGRALFDSESAQEREIEVYITRSAQGISSHGAETWSTGHRPERIWIIEWLSWSNSAELDDFADLIRILSV